jgi:hypothetical protein
MRVRRSLAIAVRCFAAVAAIVAVGAVPAAASGPRQTGGITFTATSPGTSTGTTLDFLFVNPDNPALKPYSVDKMIIHRPPGTAIDTTVPPQCHATDAEIYALGPAACPDDSWIGSGWAISDQGNNTTSQTTITHFNNQDEVVGIGVNDQIEAIKTIDRTRFEGDTSTSTFPIFPGVPPPEPYTPVKELHIRFPAYSRNGGIYNRTPLTCPSVGYWTFTTDFVYRDGVTESIESHSPCSRKSKLR